MASRKYLRCPNDGAELVRIVGATVALKMIRKSNGEVANGPLESSFAGIKAQVARDFPEGSPVHDEEEGLVCPRCDYDATVADLTATERSSYIYRGIE